MFDRSKIKSKMINYLSKKINCTNVIELIDQRNDNSTNKILMESTPVSFEIVEYNDDDNYHQKKETDNKDNSMIKYIISIFDFMVEANHTGYEYFPYLYGVLNCHDKTHSKLYVFMSSSKEL